jgi:hypothetical protein
MSTSEIEAPPTSPAPDDAADHRHAYFRANLRQRGPWIKALCWGLGFALFGYFIFAPIWGPILLLAAIGLRVLSASGLAGEKSTDDFFDAYAAKRRLVQGDKGWDTLPPVTPLLRRGVTSRVPRKLTGELAPGVTGTLALYDYLTEPVKGRTTNDRSSHPLTLAMTDVHGLAPQLHELFCRNRSEPATVERLEESLHDKKRRVELESAAFDRRYELFTRPDQDQNWVRRLFSPGFIVALTGSVPKDFAFEFADGVLVAYVPGHKKDTADLDALLAATAIVVKRLREMAGPAAPASIPAEEML